ncbi:probable ATP-dependent RNA helicase ddx42 isoform X1 [Apis cerana]|uniref:probable ATP-dependent RNA helicase ddx42 isoform X1 n=2 Tax=Apis cerana TaxID=7461 RepID=UPI0007E2B6C7|nr:probable ATP-dependent RNA helicase ddx42 isoform X1 [Apis cerana]XP_061941319.1 probable ATP-dependent RNA helicase ddx42 isoform X1 [Apis cerana]XP_061941320.1 probable ATP-dependent RNA helicase ddx42 isoform X1 [Apis cerana]XP_061941321.1 probable ATP-dependent RNA helicase ddx42 isoform X1 [Apis cerana]
MVIDEYLYVVNFFLYIYFYNRIKNLLFYGSLLVGKVSSLPQDKQENKMNIVINLNKMANILNNNKTIKSSMKTIEKETINENNNFIFKNSINTVVSTIEVKKKKNEIQNCTSTKEQHDMLNCNVTPHDDDDEDNIEQIPLLNFTESTITTVDITNINVETDHFINNNNSDTSTDLKHTTNINEASIDFISPLLVDKVVANIGSENIIKTMKSVNHTNNKHMSSGIIALITAISFAVAIALVYIGMIIWRRYIEYRYGHRELLVNELEFDTNDLRHFEL